MKVNLRPHNQPPLELFTQAPLRTTMVAVCAVRERDGTRHAGSRPGIGILARQRSFQQTTLLLPRPLFPAPCHKSSRLRVCMCVCVRCVCLCVRACTTFPRTSKRFRGKWRHKFKFGVSFVRFCYCNGHSPLSQRRVASQSSFVTKQINLRQRQRVQQS